MEFDGVRPFSYGGDLVRVRSLNEWIGGPMRLLPKDAGVLPYAWLVYLSWFVVYAIAAHDSWGWRLLDALVLAAFFPLYFTGYWLRGRKLGLIIAGLGALGVLTIPRNLGASSFFIYAAAFAGEVGKPSTAIKVLLALVAVAGIETLAIGLQPAIWASIVMMTLFVGAPGIHMAEGRRANERLRSAQKEVEQLARLAERERIARDLHDLLGHTLSVIVLKAELAAKLTEHEPARALREIRDVERISRLALAEVRQAISGFRQLTLDEAVLRAKEALAAARVDCEALLETVPLTPPAEGVLALVLREAVTNVVRHAQANRCQVRLRRETDHVRLEIVDDGVGGVKEAGTGLRGMRERVEALGGRFEHNSSRGTRVTAELPLAPVAA